MKKSGAYCFYVALATAVLHGLGRMVAPVERDKADLGPVDVRKLGTDKVKAYTFN